MFLSLVKITWFNMNRILKVLKEKGITQTWLSKQMDKSYTTINEYARNKRQPSLEDLYKIADILKVKVADLLIENIEEYNE